MNHKKHRGKNTTGHCKMCKYWKIEGMSKEKMGFERFSDHKRRKKSKEDIINFHTYTLSNHPTGL